ncbi:MAG: hypothetical protein E7138_03525 [Rikenellaceae bacterium]|nr:hypothetical protein [Rikenellaceae bacterium]
MKKNIFYLLCGVLSIALFTACSEDDPIIPEFPAATTATLVANGSTTLSINPNLEWSVELSNKTDFYIADGQNKVGILHGTAGSHQLTVFANDIEDFDEDHTCEVKMTMQGETKTIANLTVKKVDRVLSVYAAKIEDGAYVGEVDENDNFIYTYADAAAEKITMVYSLETGYTSAVKVNANFDWIVETPEWLQPVEGGDADTDVELVFAIAEDMYPASGTVAEIKFLDANNEKQGGSVEIEFTYAPHALLVGWIEAPAFFDAADGSQWPFNEGAISDYEFMNTYEAYYASKWDSETSFSTTKQIKSFKAYSYNESGSFVEITGEDSWLAGQVNEYAPKFFFIQMDDTKATAAAAKNENTGELEGVLVVEFVDGSTSAIYCHYKAASNGGGATGDIKIVSDYADLLGVTLEVVAEGDADYDAEMAGMGAAQYRLTYTMQGGAAALSLPAETNMLMSMDPWISWEGENSYMWINMTPEGMDLPAKGKIQVVDSAWNTIAIIYCVYDVEM